MRLHRRTFTTALGAGLLGAGLRAGAQADDDAALQAAVAGPARSAANRARDGARHPYETLRFFDVRPVHVVLELAPGAGWYTEILAPYLRERGRLIAAHYARDDAQDYRRRSRAAFDDKLARDPPWYDRVRVVTLTRDATWPELEPASVDRVLTFRNLHNWLEDGTLDARLQAFHRVLRPGGVFGVVDHRAAPGTPLAQQQRSGYLTEDLVAERLTSAGFAFDASTEVNANPRDTRDHRDGVWSLPPTLRSGDVERARYLAIGESDRFTQRWRRR
ncbi:MAG: methyltransferase domain-containing protein [Rubrivivax sp.]